MNTATQTLQLLFDPLDDVPSPAGALSTSIQHLLDDCAVGWEARDGRASITVPAEAAYEVAVAAAKLEVGGRAVFRSVAGLPPLTSSTVEVLVRDARARGGACTRYDHRCGMYNVGLPCAVSVGEPSHAFASELAIEVMAVHDAQRRRADDHAARALARVFAGEHERSLGELVLALRSTAVAHRAHAVLQLLHVSGRRVIALPARQWMMLAAREPTSAAHFAAVVARDFLGFLDSPAEFLSSEPAAYDAWALRPKDERSPGELPDDLLAPIVASVTDYLRQPVYSGQLSTSALARRVAAAIERAGAERARLFASVDLAYGVAHERRRAAGARRWAELSDAEKLEWSREAGPAAVAEVVGGRP